MELRPMVVREYVDIPSTRSRKCKVPEKSSGQVCLSSSKEGSRIVDDNIRGQ